MIQIEMNHHCSVRSVARQLRRNPPPVCLEVRRSRDSGTAEYSATAAAKRPNPRPSPRPVTILFGDSFRVRFATAPPIKTSTYANLHKLAFLVLRAVYPLCTPQPLKAAILPGKLLYSFPALPRPAETLTNHNIRDALRRLPEVAPFVKTGFLSFKWKLCGEGLSTGARAALRSSTRACADG